MTRIDPNDVRRLSYANNLDANADGILSRSEVDSFVLGTAKVVAELQARESRILRDPRLTPQQSMEQVQAVRAERQKAEVALAAVSALQRQMRDEGQDEIKFMSVEHLQLSFYEWFGRLDPDLRALLVRADRAGNADGIPDYDEVKAEVRAELKDAAQKLEAKAEAKLAAEAEIAGAVGNVSLYELAKYPDIQKQVGTAQQAVKQVLEPRLNVGVGTPSSGLPKVK